MPDPSRPSRPADRPPDPGTATNQDPTRPPTGPPPGPSLASVIGKNDKPPKALHQGGANIGLSYRYSSEYHQALLRCTKLAISYGLNAEESHARQFRAFYPHRRHQGNFTVTLACLGWQQYHAAMSWFTNFARNALSGDDRKYSGIYMLIELPSRGFSRYGIPVSGMGFGDHTASMVFAPTINFVSVKDNNDRNIGAIVGKKGYSQWSTEGIDPYAVRFFYPGSEVESPGSFDENLYGPTGDSPPLDSQDAQQIVNDPGTDANQDPTRPGGPLDPDAPTIGGPVRVE